MEEIEQYERIQEYLRDRMSNEERAGFENDLTTDDSLRQRYEELALLARAVKKSNQAAELKASLQKLETQLAESREMTTSASDLQDKLVEVERDLIEMGVVKPSLFQVFSKRAKRVIRAIGQWFTPSSATSTGSNNGITLTFSFSYASRMAVSFAVAASLALAVFLPYNAKKGSLGSQIAPDNIAMQTLRGDSDGYLSDAVSLYNDGDFSGAESLFIKERNELRERISMISDDESNMLALEELNAELSQVEWYLALTYLKEKKPIKAKRLLKRIAQSDTPFASEASDLINTLY